MEVERRVVDRNGVQWVVTSTLVGAATVQEGGYLPIPRPWVRFRSVEDRTEFSGPSLKGSEEMTNAELLELLEELRGLDSA